jgi:hypothetical protein
MTVPKRNQIFAQLLLDAIDDALCSLGERVKTSIYFHLEDRFQIKRQEIPERIEAFSDALDQIFGLGARHLEILFMKNLHAKTGALCEPVTPALSVSELTFKQYVDLIEQNFEKSCLEKENVEVFICGTGEKQETRVQ